MTARSLHPAFFAGLVLAATIGTATHATAKFNPTAIAPGIWHGPAPRKAADYAQLKCLGVQTVIEMRRYMPLAIRRERKQILAHGMNYCRAPMGFTPLKDGSPEVALRLITDGSKQPVYFHCNLGKDRVGLVIALFRVRYQGQSPQAAYQEFKSGQFNSLLKGLDNYFWQRTYR